MAQPIVVDLSHYNVIPESLVPARQSGIVGVIHKATEGGSYVDSDVDARWYLAREAGLLWGLYHFMRPGDQKAHAEHFAYVASRYGDQNTLLAADHEDHGVSLGDLKVWLREVERLTGRRPVIYSGHVLKDQLAGRADPELARYRLWLAQYAAKPALPPGFAEAWLWQYSDKGTVPGISPPVDVNAGDAFDVVARWAGTELFPDEDDGEQPEVVIDITATDGVKVTVRVNGDLR